MGFRITRVYTRSGDDGNTGLVDGSRVPKNCPRVAAYGDIDEANSALGVVKEELSPRCAEAVEVIEYLQQQLFDLGAELATPSESIPPQMRLISADDVSVLEELCDRFGEGLPELESFILPGGSRAAASLHTARTVSRRAERSIVALYETLKKSDRRVEVLQFVNRLSDLLFILSRWSLAVEGKHAPLWQKAEVRKAPGRPE